MVVADQIDMATGAEGAEILVLLHILCSAALGSNTGASAVAFVLGFALARGRARAFLVPLIPLWIVLRLCSGPLALEAALPALSVCTALLPAFRPILPTGRNVLAAVAAIFVAVAGGGARAMLSQGERTHALVLMDTVFLAPFAAHADALLAGWLTGRTAPPDIGSRASYTLVSAALLANGGAAVAIGYGDGFIPNATREGALLPLLAALVAAMDTLPAVHAPRAVRVLYTTIIAAIPARRVMAHRWCETSRHHHLKTPWSRMICVRPLPCSPELTRWMALLRRCSRPQDMISDGGIHPVLFIPIMLGFGLIYYAVIQEPMEGKILQWTAQAGFSSWPIQADMVFPHGAEDTGLEGVESLPKRRNSNLERILRLIGYYCGMFCFFALFMKLGLPASLYLSRTTRNPVFCALPTALYNCAFSEDTVMRSGVLQRVAKTLWFKILLIMSRGLALLALPAMLLNVFAHIVFPRANWKRMPTIEHMLENAEVASPKQMQPTEPAFHMNGYRGDSPVPPSLISLETNNMVKPEHVSSAPDALSHACRLPLDLDFVLYIRYVTRGTSAELVRHNCRRAVRILKTSGIPDAMWRVEVVTDAAVHLERDVTDKSVYEIIVPSSYRPPNGALYKARALEYAIHNSPARDLDWIVHLDEETRFDTDTVTAIIEHCGRQLYAVRVKKSEKYPRIGQGPIVYGRAMIRSLRGEEDLKRSWLTSLADSSRVSDDCGRYRLQYECGEVWVGMHGSYVVAPNCLEKLITFDHGVEGSIAEDAYFALLARAAGARFAWIDALMFEQSPFSWRDFIKQRARWLVGGLLVVSSSRIPFRVRPVMATLSTLWALMPLTYLALFLSVVLGSLEGPMARTHWFFSVLLPISASVSMWGYFFGFIVTFAGQQLDPIRFLVLLYLQMFLTPVFGLMEMSSVAYALLNFKRLTVGFHVVEKDASACRKSEHLPYTRNDSQITERTRLLSAT